MKDLSEEDQKIWERVRKRNQIKMKNIKGGHNLGRPICTKDRVKLQEYLRRYQPLSVPKGLCPPRKFTLRESFIDWRNDFTHCCTINEWSDQTARIAAQACMNMEPNHCPSVFPAATFIEGKEFHRYKTIAEMLDVYEKIFVTGNPKKRETFYNIRQREGQGFLEYMVQFFEVYTAAFTRMERTFQQNHVMYRHRFVESWYDKDLIREFKMQVDIDNMPHDKIWWSKVVYAFLLSRKLISVDKFILEGPGHIPDQEMEAPIAYDR